jgi:hypothetical protein
MENRRNDVSKGKAQLPKTKPALSRRRHDISQTGMIERLGGNELELVDPDNAHNEFGKSWDR